MQKGQIALQKNKHLNTVFLWQNVKYQLESSLIPSKISIFSRGKTAQLRACNPGGRVDNAALILEAPINA